MPGPIPDPAATRNATHGPTIPTTELPAAGRPGKAPAMPKWMRPGAAAKAWWAWAWKLPQACAWSDGDLVVVARRAVMEDDMLELDGSALNAVRNTAMQLDDRLGLTPKGMAALRWKIVADEPAQAGTAKNVTRIADRRARVANAS